MTRVAGLALVVAVCSGSVTRSGEEQDPHLAAKIERASSAGADYTVAVRVTMTVSPGWHIGAPQPGASGVPTRIEWQLPSGWTRRGEHWPPPKQEVSGKDTAFTYSGTVIIDASLVNGGGHGGRPIVAVVSYGVCKNVCIPGWVTLTLEQ